MAQYTVSGRDNEGSTIVLVNVGAIDQETSVVSEMAIVDAIRTAVAGGAGVLSVVARKYEQTITVV